MWNLDSCKLLATMTVAVLSLCQTSVAVAEVTDRHREVVQTTFDRLVAEIEHPEGWDVWPPLLKVVDNAEVQAVAYPTQTDRGYTPNVEIYTGLVEKVANFDPEILAFVVGHEIGHLVYFHGAKGAERAQKYGPVKASTAIMAAGRDQELEADLFGMRVALKAGFSHKGIRQALRGMAKAQGENYYCSFEGLTTSHPSWDLRASFLQQDDVQRELWRSMISFRNGVLFLETENYIHAEFCFREVTEEFPDCYEGWANLGYALLMQYADALDETDLEQFDIGHLVVGGFYRRPDSLTSLIRGIDEELWFEAVGAFREALRLKERLRIDDSLVMVKANLAVAYLIHPAGKQVGEAEKYFTEVLDLLDKPEVKNSLDPLLQATILINAGAGRPLDEERIALARTQLRELARRHPKEQKRVEEMTVALDYSQALQLAGSSQRGDQTSAIKAFERYLATISRASSWWEVAYGEYKALAKQLGKEPKSEADFRNPTVYEWRPVTSVTLPDGTVIGLSQLCDEILPALGEPQSVVPVVEGTNIKRHHYEQLGLSILGSRDVLAIFLNSESSPPIVIARPGVGGQSEELKVGMNRKALESLLGDEWDVQFASIDDPETVYQLYRHVGIAAQFDGDVVSELVIVLVPRKG